MSAEPSQTILSIDRSEPRFKSHTGAKIRKTKKKYNGNFDVFSLFVFVLFFLFLAKLDSNLFHPDQENERQDI